MNVSFASWRIAPHIAGRQHERPHADARGDGLRHRRRVEHALAAIHGQHGRLVGTLEADVAIRVVLEEQEAVLRRERNEPLALRPAGRHAGRVLEVRNDVDESRRVRPAERAERVDVDAVRRQRRRLHGRAEALEQQDGAVVRRRLDDRGAALPRRRGARSRGPRPGATRSSR
jgi:hypothetical protein